ncbi:nuclear transport factor 2 family protein [Gordonia phthalatica]|uniref:nuclear transport factor 2 family protein n=1 Tax=Gordonia phthalatica TaxID=1136941 RepID=UPI000AB014C9|nr:nuclear transport factor 2 family protein [Gordonia phthalatica]
MSDIETRLRLVEDRLEILNLEGLYAETWDFGDADGWAALFTDDGVFEMLSPTGEVTRTVAGTADLTAFCEDLNRTFQGLHLIHAPRVTLDGDIASAHIQFTFEAHRAHDLGFDQTSVTDAYSVLYVRTTAGWRMKRRVERAMNRNSRTAHPGSFALRPV